MKVGIIGGGWAGLSAAVGAVQKGHSVTVYEASRTLGGRARVVHVAMPDGSPVALDNGQHILIGAYRETLRLMRLVGVDPEAVLLRTPLTLLFPDGGGLQFPPCFAPLDALAGIARARGWSLAEKFSLLRAAARWQMAGFQCRPEISVDRLCAAVSPRVRRELIEPLCISALNTPPDRASGEVFLRVMHDALLGPSGGSNLLLPRADLSAIFPDAAARWLAQRGAQVHVGRRVQQLEPEGVGWRIDGAFHDLLVLATPVVDATRLLEESRPRFSESAATSAGEWTAVAGALQHEAITTVYLWSPGARLPHPMLALRSGASTQENAPAQFVFDRGQLGGPSGLMAFVVSTSTEGREIVQCQVMSQAKAQLGLDLQPVQTVVEKRATFACIPNQTRPAAVITTRLLACGDYVQGPYPATLEGAVLSGLAVAAYL